MMRSSRVIKPKRKRNIIVSLCDTTGTWSQPFADNGFDVLRFDLSEGLENDARLLTIAHDLQGKIYGVISAPPCNHFCIGGAHLWHRKNRSHIIQGMSVIDACIRISVMSQPYFWALENPPGRLHHWLGEPRYKFQPYWFGDPYSKYTYLWGRFNTNLVEHRVKPVKGHIRNQLNKYSMKYASFFRSMTPKGFATAFYNANSNYEEKWTL